MLASLFAVLAGGCSQDPAERAKKTPTAELLPAIVAAERASPEAAALQSELAQREAMQLVDALLPALSSENLPLRHRAIDLLGWRALDDDTLDQDSRQRAERALLQLLRSDDEDSRSFALCSLACSWRTTNRDPVPEFLPTLRAQLTAKSAMARNRACHAAAMSGPAVAELAPMLIERCTTDSDVGVRMMAVAALRTVAPNATATYQAMTSSIVDSAPDVRRLAVTHLQEAPGIEPATVQSLLRLLETDPDEDVRDGAADTLAAHTIGAESATRALTTVLKLRDTIRKDEKLIALGRLAAQATNSEPAKAARERLERALYGSDAQLTHMASCGLARIAFAERNLELAARMSKALNATIGTADVDQALDLDLVREIASTLVLLADWVELALDRAPVRAYLRGASEHESWAARLLEQLDKLGK